MAVLPTQSFATIVQQIATGMQGRASALLNFVIGSVFRAMAEAYAGVSLWLQAMILQLLLVTRLNTSSGVDVDTFVGDFEIIKRLGSEAATGAVTFARFTAGPSAPFIPVNSVVKTGDGSQAFQVYADPTNTAYSATLGGYTMPAETTSVSVPVISITPSPNSLTSGPGANGNVSSGSITQIASALPGVDTVVNSAAFTNGIDEETDAALKKRFPLAILGLSRGDLYGTDAALAATAVNVQFQVVEDQNFDGTYRPGYYFVVCDDGSGSPPTAFVALVRAAVLSVRPLGINAGVFACNKVLANVAMLITSADGFTHSVVIAQVGAAVAAGINGLGLGNGLQFYQLAAWAFSVPGVVGVSAVTLNSLSGDSASIAASQLVTIKSGTLTIS